VNSLRIVRDTPEMLERAMTIAPEVLASRGDDSEAGCLRAYREAIASPPMPAPFTQAPPRVNQLNIGNTLRCNMQCTYCYNSFPGEAPRVPLTCGPDHARRCVDALLEQHQSKEPLTLVFIGGESLLQYELLREVIGYARERCAAHAVSSGRRSIPTPTDGPRGDRVGE